MQFDSSLTDTQKGQVFTILAGVALGSLDGVKAIATMLTSDHMVTVGVYGTGITLEGGTESAAPFGVTNDKIGGDAKMTLQTNPVEHARLDGTKEVLSPTVIAAHESEHGAEMVTGTQEPRPALLPLSGKDYITHPSEAGAVKVENAQRQHEGLLPRDR